MSFRHPHTRASYALLAAMVWVGGFEVAPWVHVVGHEVLPEHTHGADESRADDGFRRSLGSAVQRMATGELEASAAETPHAHVTAPEEGVNPDHGAHSTAHRDLAVAGAALPPAAPPRARLCAVLQVDDATSVWSSAPVFSALARGPPRV